MENIIEKMTLEEKAALINGAAPFRTAEIPCFDIKQMRFLDGGTGINFEQFFSDLCFDENEEKPDFKQLRNVTENFYNTEKLTRDELELQKRLKEKLDDITKMPELAPGCFPSGIMLGSTFDPEIVRRVGEALGAEAEAYGIDVLLGTPNINIHRDPLGGRVFEGYSEDPCLVSSLAPELVKGVQEYSVSANVKHFAANNQEKNRVGINEIISNRALEEIYFPGFKACVTEGNVRTVMSAYNKINGVLCTENKWLLTDKLRKDWGFDGMVVSDWGAVCHSAAAVEAGNDLAMPGPLSRSLIIDAVRNGIISEEILDNAVRNILKLYSYKNEEKKFSSAKELMEYTDKIAYDAAAAGIVLLKNENNIFPLSAGGNPVFITGTGSEKILTCGSGSAGVVTNRNTSLVDELKARLGEKNVTVTGNISGKIKGKGEIVLVIASLSGMEGNDRPDMKLNHKDRSILSELIKMKKYNMNFQIGLILNVCGPVSLSEYKMYIDGIFCMYLPGMQGGRAMADILTGKVNPSGKLPITFPEHYRDTPTYISKNDDGHEITYGEGIFVGYRYYERKKIKPAYPFGYGLSYTYFSIYDIETDKERFEDEITIRGKIKNTGTMAGAQVVQIYVSDICSSIMKPQKELKKFKKIFLETGEETGFEFTLTEKDFEYFDTDYGCFLSEEGYFDIIVSVSSAAEDTAAIKRVYKEGTSPYTYGLNSTVKVLFENEELKELLFRYWKQEGLDTGMLENIYQYTPSRRLYEIISDRSDEGDEENNNLSKFLDAVSKVEKR